jgi:hypothetical protein
MKRVVDWSCPNCGKQMEHGFSGAYCSQSEICGYHYVRVLPYGPPPEMVAFLYSLPMARNHLGNLFTIDGHSGLFVQGTRCLKRSFRSNMQDLLHVLAAIPSNTGYGRACYLFTRMDAKNDQAKGV